MRSDRKAAHLQLRYAPADAGAEDISVRPIGRDYGAVTLSCARAQQARARSGAAVGLTVCVQAPLAFLPTFFFAVTKNLPDNLDLAPAVR